MAVVAIEVGGVDVTAHVLFSTCRFMSQTNGSPGDFYARLRDPDRTLSFVTGTDVLVKIDGEAVWRGYLQQAQRVFVFPAINVDAFGEARFMDLTGADVNVLFNKRIVFDQADPTNVAGDLYPPFQADDVVIADLVAYWLDLSSDTIDTSTFVEHVGDITDDQEGRAWSGGDTWGQAMQSIAMLPAAVFYLKPTLTGADLVYTDVDTPNAPFAMSDVPGPGIVGYREMEITKDGTGLVNDQLAWGMGYGSQSPVFVRDEDAASQALHGLWQAGTVRPGIYKQATINRVAASIVDGSPSSHRGAKDDKVSVELTTYQPGFLPGQKIDFTSEVWDFTDVIPIRKMEITFEAPDNPKFRLTLSHEIDAPWGFIDQYLPNFAFPPFPPFPPLPGFTMPPSTVCIILDDWDRADVSTYEDPTHTADPAIWNTASGGGTWNVEADDAGGTVYIGIEDQAAFISLPPTEALPPDFTGTLTDANALWRAPFRMNVRFHPMTLPSPGEAETALGQSCVFGSGRGGAGGDAYVFVAQNIDEVNPSASGTSVGITSGPDSASVLIASLLTNAWYWLAWEHDPVNGFSRAKIWIDGDTEPDWLFTLTLTDVTYPGGATTFPVYSIWGSTSDLTVPPYVWGLDILEFCYIEETGSMYIDPSGNGCEVPLRVGPGVYQLSSSIDAGTARVYVNGFLQRRGGLLEYTEDPPNGQIIFNWAEIPDASAIVYVCYVPGAPL